MKHPILFCILLLLLAIGFTGCICKHTFEPATCEDTATCSQCGETQEGSSKLGHSWSDATCEQPRTCVRCDATMGSALGHTWNDATCTAPMTCTKCDATIGVPNEHQMNPATCSKPSTCSVCKITEGEPLPHQLSAATCTKAPTCSVCKITEGEPLPHQLSAATCTKGPTCSVCNKVVGKALGHDYKKNICTLCGDKMIETHSELESYLNRNFQTLTTSIGTLKYLSIEVKHNDPNYWHSQDFEICIESTLWFREVDCSLGYALVYADFIPYATRIQAVVDVLNYQKSIVEIAEAAFPGQKFEVKFYTWGYEYPSIQVGFNSETMMCWRNWESAPGGGSGYAGTRLTSWEIYTFDMMDYGTYDQQQRILSDIRKAWPHNPIDNY